MSALKLVRVLWFAVHKLRTVQNNGVLEDLKAGITVMISLPHRWRYSKENVQSKNFLCQRNSPLKWKSQLGLLTSTVEWCDHQFHSKLLGIVCNVICQNERTQLSALHPLHTRIYSLMTATASGMLGYHIPTFSPNGFTIVLSKLTS